MSTDKFKCRKMHSFVPVRKLKSKRHACRLRDNTVQVSITFSTTDDRKEDTRWENYFGSIKSELTKTKERYQRYHKHRCQGFRSKQNKRLACQKNVQHLMLKDKMNQFHRIQSGMFSQLKDALILPTQTNVPQLAEARPCSCRQN